MRHCESSNCNRDSSLSLCISWLVQLLCKHTQGPQFTSQMTAAAPKAALLYRHSVSQNATRGLHAATCAASHAVRLPNRPHTPHLRRCGSASVPGLATRPPAPPARAPGTPADARALARPRRVHRGPHRNRSSLLCSARRLPTQLADLACVFDAATRHKLAQPREPCVPVLSRDPLRSAGLPGLCASGCQSPTPEEVLH